MIWIKVLREVIVGSKHCPMFKLTSLPSLMLQFNLRPQIEPVYMHETNVPNVCGRDMPFRSLICGVPEV
jgi:hypothetical protein